MTPLEVRREIHNLVRAIELTSEPTAKLALVQDRMRALIGNGQTVPEELGWIEKRLRAEFSLAA